MYPPASAGLDQPTYVSDPAHLPGLLQQLVADLADPAITYLLGGHYYDRTNHPRYRHFPAVFALRQGEVANVEVGPDFAAFDTKLVRYPERGEPHYPGPWADHFRATVPFAQLYQLGRQVLPAAEQAAEKVSYGPETILYYNAAVYQQPPTPVDSNQAYAAAPPSGEHPLVAVLMTVEAGLADPVHHYLIHTTAFESPDGLVVLGLLHLHAQITRALIIAPDAFTCSVLLDPHDRQRWSTIRVNFAQVWQVLRSDSPQVDLQEVEDTGGLLYDAPEVLRAYARQGRLA